MNSDESIFHKKFFGIKKEGCQLAALPFMI